MTKRYALRDDQWERIKDMLPGQEGSVGATAKDNRLFVEAVIYRYRAGIPWRDIPYQSDLGIFESFIPDLAAGQKRGYGRESLRHWAQMPTTNTQ